MSMKRGFAAVLALTVAIVLCSCGGEQQSAQSEPIPSAAENGQKLAGSMDEYIDQVLSWDSTTDRERTVLERAKRDGKLSISDYEQAWSDFKSCMVDRGYPPFELVSYNGIYAMPALKFTGTENEWEKYKKDYDSCYGQITAIVSIYTMQVANPNLYTDMVEAVADCLRREKVVPADYTADDLRRESGSDQGSGEDPYEYFDRTDPVFRGCKVANGWTTAYANDERVDLWHGTGGNDNE
ncbi:hypothetical protein H7U32_01805 [Bifidobacterium pullorum subsp. saeculare]|uniref:Lipoprotein n=1 Tax=Bifidobacterium pullorum subsp. saeculare TaxID=78257 RepID=A0A938WWR1_9BIFI|nr:hypothetical protein [Bifidobacterium pullorum]MBM6699082.1 hypothetical protein [Bifidobacterium pullorum subsp. saeculare]